MTTFTTIHDVTSIEVQKHIIEGSGGKPCYVTTFVIKADDGKMELRVFSPDNIVIDFKQTEVIE